jgi:hypothetical protein
MPLEDFNDQVRERRLAHFKAAIDPTLLDTLFNVPRLEHLLHRESRLTPHIDIFDGRTCGNSSISSASRGKRISMSLRTTCGAAPRYAFEMPRSSTHGSVN